MTTMRPVRVKQGEILEITVEGTHRRITVYATDRGSFAVAGSFLVADINKLYEWAGNRPQALAPGG